MAGLPSAWILAGSFQFHPMRSHASTRSLQMPSSANFDARRGLSPASTAKSSFAMMVEKLAALGTEMKRLLLVLARQVNWAGPKTPRLLLREREAADRSV